MLALKDTIHRLSGEKYDGRLDEEMKRSLENAKKFPKFDVRSHPASSNGSGNDVHPPQDAGTSQDDTSFVLDCLKQGEWGDSLLFARLFRGHAIYDHIGLLNPPAKFTPLSLNDREQRNEQAHSLGKKGGGMPNFLFGSTFCHHHW